MSSAQYIQQTDSWLGAFVLRGGPGKVETLLPYRDEFSGASPFILRGIIAAFADLTGQIAGASSGSGQKHAGSLWIEYIDTPASGEQLHGRGNLVGEQIQVEIRTSDTQTLVARARVALDKPAVAQAFASEQPIYPN